MSAKDPNMKVIIGADTKDFDKGAKDVKQGLNDLNKVTDQALGSLGNMFGVNTGKIGQMASAMKGLGVKMSECGNAGVSAFGNILKAIGPVEVAIAGIGIAGAVAAFKNLNAEADAFKNTVAGANIEMATAAYVDTYRQVLRDFNSSTGSGIAHAWAEAKKIFGEFGAVVSDFFASDKFLNPAGNAQESAAQYRAAGEAAEKAEKLTDEIYKLERRRKEQTVELARLNADIADKMAIARDATASTADREDAIYKIELMLSQKKAMTAGIEQRLAELYQERSSLASDSVEAADATIAQTARAFETERAITLEETSLLKIKNSIGKASEAEIARMNKLLEQQKKLQEEIDKVHKKWATVSESGAISGVAEPTFSGVITPKLTILPQVDAPYWRDIINAQLGDITIGIGFKTDTQKIQDITNEVTNLLQSGIARTGEIIGNLVGTLAAGGDAWGDFKNAAISAFGDMAIAVGKIAVSAGVATLGIKAAFESLNGYAAIAAGAALIALGSAVKSSLSSVANGDYSASAGGYSGGYSGGTTGNNWETREVNVNVTGTLVADGDQLKAALNNADKKSYYTG